MTHTVHVSVQREEVQLEPEEQQQELPEGFFDDPKLDAKARNVEFVDSKEEEWSKFQKEIAQEVETSAEIAKEEREEATDERQIQDIDDQIQAWARVSNLEKRLESAVKKDPKGEVESESSDSDQDPEELFDWRKKKS